MDGIYTGPNCNKRQRDSDNFLKFWYTLATMDYFWLKDTSTHQGQVIKDNSCNLSSSTSCAAWVVKPNLGLHQLEQSVQFRESGWYVIYSTYLKNGRGRSDRISVHPFPSKTKRASKPVYIRPKAFKSLYIRPEAPKLIQARHALRKTGLKAPRIS